jgi:choline-sulfatase
MLTRRSLVTAAASAAALRGQAGRRPNFVFLLADDHAGYVLGADGNRRAETPHLDRLAGESVRFARHHCNSPICTPSRQSLLTGLLPHAAGVTLLASRLAEDSPTLARQFQQAGYRTAVFGKMHFNRPGRPGLFGFETCMTEDVVNREWGRRPPARAVHADVRTKPAWRPFQDPARIWLNAEKLPYPRYDEDMKGTFLARQAERYLEDRRRDGEPFALWVSFMEPHSPYDFPVEDRGHFDPASFPPPALGPEDAAQVPEVFADLTPAEKSGIIASYYTSVRFLDRNVGAVLKKLADLGLDGNTFLIYSADHGYCLGQHGRFEKHIGYDPALRVPLLMRWPGRVRPAVVRDFTEHVDVSATVTDVLGLEPLPGRHGQSLRPYLEGRRPASPRDHVFSEYLETEQAYLRTDRHKFIYATGRRLDWYRSARPPAGRWKRLYDLQADPGELHDISARKPALVGRFQAMLLDRFRGTHPDAGKEPPDLGAEEALDFYLRPRDAA